MSRRAPTGGRAAPTTRRAASPNPSSSTPWSPSSTRDPRRANRARRAGRVFGEGREVVFVVLAGWGVRPPLPPPAPTRPGGRPRVYSDRLFLKALVIMLVRRLTTAYELLSVLAEPTAEMQTLRVLLLE